MSNPVSDLVAGFQDLVAQMPDLLQPFVVALAGAVPFIEGEGAAAIGVVGGIHPVVAALSGAIGNFVCVAIVVLATAAFGPRSPLARALRRRRRRHAPRSSRRPTTATARRASASSAR